MTNEHDTPPPNPPVPPTAAAPAPAPATAPAPAPAEPDALRQRWDDARRDARAPGPLEQRLETLVRDVLRERRTDRRWRIALRLAWLLLFGAVVWALLAGRGGHGGAPGGMHTALVELRGEIAAEGEASADNLIAGLRKAFENPHAKAVVLRINSGGGSPVQSGIVNDEIQRLKKLHKKKLYAVVEEICASGAYYIAVAADEVVVDKASLVGSIGVIIDGFGFTGTMNKLGVERRLITAGDNKAILDPFSPENPKQRAYIQQMVNEIHQQFIAVVRNGRGARLKEQPETFSGLVWNGTEAIRYGLADRLGSLDQVARDVVKAEEIVDYSVRSTVAERLAKRFGATMAEALARQVVTQGTTVTPPR